MKKRRPKPQKRVRMKVERKVHRNRLRPCRVVDAYPDPNSPFKVEIRLCPNRWAMRNEINFHEGEKFAKTVERDCMGLVRSWWSPRLRLAGVARPGQIVARIFLNAKDLRRQPGEIVSHECGHAAMAWARFRRANLFVMPGEEVMCYALGRLVARVNTACYAHRIWT